MLKEGVFNRISIFIYSRLHDNKSVEKIQNTTRDPVPIPPIPIPKPPPEEEEGKGN